MLYQAELRCLSGVENATDAPTPPTPPTLGMYITPEVYAVEAAAGAEVLNFACG